MDFSNHLFSCSSLSKIMTREAGKNNQELYADAIAKQNALYDGWQNAKEAYDAMKNKETETAKKKDIIVGNWAARFAEQELIVANLELIKDSVSLTDGCKKHLLDLYVCFVWNRNTPDIKTKYIMKGLKVEEQVITLYSALTQHFYDKNTERKDNGFITGEIDTEDEIFVIDAKASWDCFTFKRNLIYLDKPESNPYYWNMQGYSVLWEKPRTKVVYGLIDTPKELIQKEKQNLYYSFVGTEADYEEACNELEKNMKYPDIAMDERIIEIIIDQNEKDCMLIEKNVIEARKFLNSIKRINYEDILV